MGKLEEKFSNCQAECNNGNIGRFFFKFTQSAIMGILKENFENFKQCNKEHSGGNFQNTKQSAIRGKLYEKFSKYPTECNNGYIGIFFQTLTECYNGHI